MEYVGAERRWTVIIWSFEVHTENQFRECLTQHRQCAYAAPHL